MVTIMKYLCSLHVMFYVQLQCSVVIIPASPARHNEMMKNFLIMISKVE